MDKDLKDKTPDELEKIVVDIGQKKYLTKYIFSFIHTMNISDISALSTLSKTFRAQLTEGGYYISQLKVVEKLTDADGTVKYLFELGDGNRIETVLLFDDDGRRTLCVSTQAGCEMNCTFCATAKVKFRRNLTAAEIADQVNIAQKDGGRIANVVYMGMGEPMLNYEAVVKSVRILNHPDGKNIGIRHLTVSTCGDAAGIERLADEDIHPRLAISLNAPTDAIRAKLMPVTKKYPIARILKAVGYYQEKTGDRVTFEYVLIKGVNDTVLHAQMTAKVLRGIKCNVNLIEYNPHPHCAFAGSGRERIKRFAGVLEKAGFETVVRFKKGQGIKAACGQLGADWANGSTSLTANGLPGRQEKTGGK